MTASFLKAGLIGVLGVAPCLLKAERIVSSLTNSITEVTANSGSWLASPFRTDARDRLLTSIVVNLGVGSTAANVRLFSDNGGQPGGTLADLGTLAITGTNNSLWAFIPGSRVWLRASTTYWVGVGAVHSNGLVFGLILDSTNFSVASAPGASATNFAAAGFSSTTNPPALFDSFGTNVVLPFQVDGDAVTLAVLTFVRQPGGAVKISSTNGFGYPHLIQAATNLGPSAVWQNLGSNALGPGGVWEFTDVNAPNHPRRFYRSAVP